MMDFLCKTGFGFLLLYVNQAHGLSHGAIKAILFLVVIKVGRTERVIHPFPGLLLVEVVVLDEGVDPFFLCVKIVLLAAITRIGNGFFRVEAIKGFILLKMVDISGGIGGGLVKSVIGDELLVHLFGNLSRSCLD